MDFNVKVRGTAAAVLLLAGALAASGCATIRHQGTQEAHLIIPEKCGDLTFPVYFEAKGAAITRPARQLIAEAGRANRECRVARVDIIGLDDYRGAGKQTLDLSRMRAKAVAKALAAAGFPEPAFGVVAAGVAGHGADGMPDMLQRRADVTVHYQPSA